MSLNLELAANVVITVSILLAARNSVHTWWTGIVGCVLFALVFHGAKLYAEVGLQAFFIATKNLDADRAFILKDVELFTAFDGIPYQSFG